MKTFGALLVLCLCSCVQTDTEVAESVSLEERLRYFRMVLLTESNRILRVLTSTIDHAFESEMEQILQLFTIFPPPSKQSIFFVEDKENVEDSDIRAEWSEYLEGLGSAEIDERYAKRKRNEDLKEEIQMRKSMKADGQIDENIAKGRRLPQIRVTPHFHDRKVDIKLPLKLEHNHMYRTVHNFAHREVNFAIVEAALVHQFLPRYAVDTDKPIKNIEFHNFFELPHGTKIRYSLNSVTFEMPPATPKGHRAKINFKTYPFLPWLEIKDRPEDEQKPGEGEQKTEEGENKPEGEKKPEEEGKQPEEGEKKPEDKDSNKGESQEKGTGVSTNSKGSSEKPEEWPKFFIGEITIYFSHTAVHYYREEDNTIVSPYAEVQMVAYNADYPSLKQAGNELIVISRLVELVHNGARCSMDQLIDMIKLPIPAWQTWPEIFRSEPDEEYYVNSDKGRDPKMKHFPVSETTYYISSKVRTISSSPADQAELLEYARKRSQKSFTKIDWKVPTAWTRMVSTEETTQSNA